MTNDKIAGRASNAQPLLLRAACDIADFGGIADETRQRLYDFGYTAADVERAVTHLRNQA